MASVADREQTDGGVGAGLHTVMTMNMKQPPGANPNTQSLSITQDLVEWQWNVPECLHIPTATRHRLADKNAALQGFLPNVTTGDLQHSSHPAPDTKDPHISSLEPVVRNYLAVREDLRWGDTAQGDWGVVVVVVLVVLVMMRGRTPGIRSLER
ncbi:unnamed protein product [Lota lota]